MLLSVAPLQLGKFTQVWVCVCSHFPAHTRIQGYLWWKTTWTRDHPSFSETFPLYISMQKDPSSSTTPLFLKPFPFIFPFKRTSYQAPPLFFWNLPLRISLQKDPSSSTTPFFLKPFPLHISMQMDPSPSNISLLRPLFLKRSLLYFLVNEPLTKEWQLFLRMWGLWRNVWRFVSCLHFFSLVFEVEMTCTRQFHFLGQDQSTVAQWAETTVAECLLMS